ncbi:MAG TPA: DUF3072 domain-containing protein [Ramlibacter sp.]|uniref:DUF3072 domain-containing protein n=1 Tax=Ramlibacter sp. TaxID=1917967 RepID=UPI002D5F66C1|nr:DUF3072 domain-containing protein [Ramlibacter sp.]HZY17428.1 DUF3072 domain-containing protein [Ramlibacter sp.]
MAEQSNMEKDPADWVTGDEPMTGAQRSYLKTLSEEAKEPFDETLSKADASRRIDALQEITGRGSHGHAGRDAAPERAGAAGADGAAGAVQADQDLADGRATAGVETVFSR